MALNPGVSFFSRSSEILSFDPSQSATHILGEAVFALLTTQGFNGNEDNVMKPNDTARGCEEVMIDRD